MGVEIIRRPRSPRFNADGVAAMIKALVPGYIISRTGRGVDMHGKAFRAYSKRYLRVLRAMGEDTGVDLRLTGGMINSVKARGIEKRATGVTIYIAPDTGTSPVVRPPSTAQELSRTNALRGGGTAPAEGTFAGPLRRGANTKLGKALTPRRVSTGERGPIHSELAYWIHHGTKKMPARKFMGLTEEQTKSLFDEIEKVCWVWR